MTKLASVSLWLASALALAHFGYESLAFRSAATARLSSRGKFGVYNSQSSLRMGKKLAVLERESDVLSSSYDPLNLASRQKGLWTGIKDSTPCRPNTAGGLLASTAALLFTGSQTANAADSVISTGSMNPATFQPVCPASDNFYRLLQGSVQAIVGKDKFVEYGPLIAGGLLRVRLELCVVESFFNEAVGPFIQENGLSWILPLHETVETFLAGSIFALATTFILVGSTKLLTVIITYFDLLVSASVLYLVFLGTGACAVSAFFRLCASMVPKPLHC
jgi:hypothetical protein